MALLGPEVGNFLQQCQADSGKRMDLLVYGSSSDDSDKSEGASTDTSESSSNSGDSSSEEDHEKKPVSNILPSALDALKSAEHSKSFIARAEAAAAVNKKETTVLASNITSDRIHWNDF